MTLWRVGTKVPLNVYEGNRPVCQCHNPLDAEQIASAVNLQQQIHNPDDHLTAAQRYDDEQLAFLRWLERVAPKTVATWRDAYAREEGRKKT